ncbi:hypothetical protein [Ligilactobacillus salivarius]|nr:hypothetical protein [Ligilactobacillus salivarius]
MSKKFEIFSSGRKTVAVYTHKAFILKFAYDKDIWHRPETPIL